MDRSTLSGMTTGEIAEYINQVIDRGGELSGQERAEIHDVLADRVWHIGRVWDLADGTDIYRGSSTYGTPNHRSMTYKFRKVAGFSYP